MLWTGGVYFFVVVMLIPNSILFYIFKHLNSFFFVVVSFFQGWFLFQVGSQSHLLGCIKKGLSFGGKSFFNVVFGLFKNFVYFLTLKGMGFKLIGLQYWVSLIIKLGFSHRIFFRLPSDLKVFFTSNQLVCVKARSFFFLKNIVYSFFRLKKLPVYKKKGFFFKGSLFHLKATSKKLKF